MSMSWYDELVKWRHGFPTWRLRYKILFIFLVLVCIGGWLLFQYFTKVSRTEPFDKSVTISESHINGDVVYGNKTINSYVSTKENADLHLEFLQAGPAFRLRNRSSVVADLPSYGFVIWDLDDKESIQPLPIKWKETSYVGSQNGRGPWLLLEKYGKPDHRYFGFAKITCKNCSGTKLYWIYTEYGKAQKSWYAEAAPGDLRKINFSALKADSDKYLDSLLPRDVRLPFYSE